MIWKHIFNLNIKYSNRHLYDGGVRRAWRGLRANQFRLAVVNVSELVTYDIVKDTIIDMKLMKDSSGCHFTSAAIAGIMIYILVLNFFFYCLGVIVYVFYSSMCLLLFFVCFLTAHTNKYYPLSFIQFHYSSSLHFGIHKILLYHVFY